ncbi:MAG: trypsin-like peptidase domain-containing protein, partial [Rhodoplanes sp.]
MERSVRFLLLAILLVLGVMVAQPYVQQRFFSATAPRPIEARGDLMEIERTTIAIFDRVSPSVVQVAGRSGAGDFSLEGEEGGVQSGTGFLWDAAGHVVTNHHVVQSTGALAVRLASGEATRASVVGT